MKNEKNYEKMIELCEKRFNRYLKKHDVDMALFYRNAKNGFEIKKILKH